MQTTADIKKLWKAFWTNKIREHKIVEPVSLISSSQDSTALFNVAGMQQLVPYLSGKQHPLGSRLYNIQKCLRTNDIEDIGDERHLSMFEMMGNRSLGDYFKKESLTWSVEFLVDVLGLEKSRLGCSIFGGYKDKDDNEIIPYDTEAEEILLSLGISSTRIKAISMTEGEKCDNFRGPAGEMGPCGPCAEFHYDRGDARGPNDWNIGVNDRFIEIWNNVFMEFYKNEDRTFQKLSQQNVDTGMGLERLMMVLQNKDTVFETDIFAPYIGLIEDFSHVPYPPYHKKQNTFTKEEINQTKSYRVIIDHVRSATFLIADGVMPSNDARGYVLRRLIRRMTLHLCLKLTSSREIGILIEKMVKRVCDAHKDTYATCGEVDTVQVARIILDEIKQFLKTVDRGEQKLQKILAKSYDTMISGDDAFLLYDTFGFPVELTQELAEGEGYTIDMVGFAESMNIARQKAKDGSREMFAKGIDRASHLQGIQPTQFVGYEERSVTDPRVVKQIMLDDDRLVIVFDKTPFYAESGGQTGDYGQLQFDDGTTKNIVDVKKYEGIFLHFVE